jgi:SulP family sulfate permease
LKSCGTTIIISGANRQVKEELFKSEFYSLIGKNNILDSINQAIERAEKINNE